MCCSTCHKSNHIIYYILSYIKSYNISYQTSHFVSHAPIKNSTNNTNKYLRYVVRYIIHNMHIQVIWFLFELFSECYVDNRTKAMNAMSIYLSTMIFFADDVWYRPLNIHLNKIKINNIIHPTINQFINHSSNELFSTAI